jgi:hypothetical protein
VTETPDSIACSDQDSGVTPDRSEILRVSPRELSKAEAAFLESSGFTGRLERRRPPAGVLCLRWNRSRPRLTLILRSPSAIVVIGSPDHGSLIEIFKLSKE